MTKSDIESLVAPARYQLAKAEKRTAYEQYNYAGVALELAQIRERFAELYSQQEPIATIQKRDGDERNRLCSSAYYVIYGRLPDKE